MKKEPLQLENQDTAEQDPLIETTKDQRLKISMVSELASRFGLRQAHNVASVLKVSQDEAKDLLILAAAQTGTL